MSALYSFLLVIGLLLVINPFRTRINRANRIIEIGTIPNTTFPKFPHVRKAEYEKGIHQVNAGMAVVSYLAISLNFRFGVVDGWVILALVGISLSVSSFLLLTIPESFEYEEFSESARLKIQLRREEAKKVSFFILIVTVGLSGNWAYQQNKNQSWERESAIQTVNSLTETGWCSNFEDINVYDGGAEVVKKGGWPCIYVGSVDSFYFSKENKLNKMCAWFNLNRENGFPGEESFQLSYRRFEICALDNFEESWSEYTFEDKLYEKVKPDLDALQVALCRKIGYQMGELNYSTYC